MMALILFLCIVCWIACSIFVHYNTQQAAYFGLTCGPKEYYLFVLGGPLTILAALISWATEESYDHE